ncbi:VanW like protein [Desulfoscipio geothermicus DSM 3669]|uniref:VanW like protein n=1 Tax=Desulfoscipio geothermicus DSM 3669 TaxID=1121426 RepID=A0A1I6E496_9FIRM|nr:VanW like protein [Desulfoscipio geothermicus DSM 3669]
MTAILFIAMASLSLILWHIDLTVCTGLCSQLDIGFLNRSWFLWGAVYYSIAGILTTWFNKNWAVIALLINGILFHFFLIVNGYKITNLLCPICIAFLGAEIVLLILYVMEKPQQQNKYLVFGPGKAVFMVALIVFALNPASIEIPIDSHVASAEVKHEESGALIQETEPSAMVDQVDEAEKPGQVDTGKILTVENSHGITTQIDISQKPALLFAWWCAHCDQALKEYAKYQPDKRPYLVAVFLKGTNDREYIEQKLKANGIKGEYYIYRETPPVESVPVLIWRTGGKINKAVPVAGEQRLLGIARIQTGNGNGGYNAVLAGAALNETIVLPGEVFSFNETVGERTPEKGYRVSRVIVVTGNGPEYAEGIGGGICRTSTVLNWAVENAGLEVVEQHPHSLPVEYGKERGDTAVAWPSLDYRFRNNTGEKITIKTKTVGEWLEVEIWAG